MSTSVQEAKPARVKKVTEQAHRPQNGVSKARALRYPLPELPKLGWEYGHKIVRNERTGELTEAPLTLLDLLYPTGEELFIGEAGLTFQNSISSFGNDTTIDARLVSPDDCLQLLRAETQARTKAEARAEAEAAARQEVERKLTEAMARLQVLEARYGNEQNQ